MSRSQRCCVSQERYPRGDRPQGACLWPGGGGAPHHQAADGENAISPHPTHPPCPEGPWLEASWGLEAPMQQSISQDSPSPTAGQGPALNLQRLTVCLLCCTWCSRASKSSKGSPSFQRTWPFGRARCHASVAVLLHPPIDTARIQYVPHVPTSPPKSARVIGSSAGMDSLTVSKSSLLPLLQPALQTEGGNTVRKLHR